MDELDLKACILTQIALDHFGGDIDAAVAAVKATEQHVIDQVNVKTKAAIAAEAVTAGVGAELPK